MASCDFTWWHSCFGSHEGTNPTKCEREKTIRLRPLSPDWELALSKGAGSRVRCEALLSALLAFPRHHPIPSSRAGTTPPVPHLPVTAVRRYRRTHPASPPLLPNAFSVHRLQRFHARRRSYNRDTLVPTQASRGKQRVAFHPSRHLGTNGELRTRPEMLA